MSKLRQLLVEKYRPTTIDDYIFQTKENEENIRKWIAEKEIPNVILIGTPGTGKTTISRILVNEMGISPTDVKNINVALVKGIDFVRDELIPWIKKRGMSKFKIVQLEELNRLSPDAQKAMLGVMEDYSDSVRFIATTNFVSTIIPPLLSRFTAHLHMSEMKFDDIVDYVVGIVESEGLQIRDEYDLTSHIEAFQPDVRSIVNSISSSIVDGFITPATNSSKSADISKWEEIWTNGNVMDRFTEVVDLCEFVDQTNYEWFYEVMYSNHKQFAEPYEAMVKLSTYLDRATRASNQRLHMKACLYDIFLVE